MTDRPVRMSDLDRLRERMSKIFEDLVRQNHPLLVKGEKHWVPAVDIYETPTKILILVELAGVTREQITVTLEKGLLSIAGERLERCQDRKVRMHQMEIDFGSFHRRIQIQVPIEEDQITSEYRDGFLEIQIPKKPAEIRRAIPIEDGE